MSRKFNFSITKVARFIRDEVTDQTAYETETFKITECDSFDEAINVVEGAVRDRGIQLKERAEESARREREEAEARRAKEEEELRAKEAAGAAANSAEGQKQEEKVDSKDDEANKRRSPWGSKR